MKAKKSTISKEQKDFSRGLCQELLNVEERLEELESPLRKRTIKRDLTGYLEDEDFFPDFEKVCGENDLTPKDVFCFGSLAVIVALKLKLRKDLAEGIGEEMLIELLKDIDKSSDETPDSITAEGNSFEEMRAEVEKKLAKFKASKEDKEFIKNTLDKIEKEIK